MCKQVDLKNSPTLHFTGTVSKLVQATARLPSFLEEELAGKPAEVHSAHSRAGDYVHM